MSDIYSNYAFCRVASGVTTGATTIAVDDVTSLPSNSAVTANDFYMAFDAPLTHPATQEIVKVTGVSGTNLTVVRAQEGTTAGTWATGNLMRGTLTAGMIGRVLNPVMQTYTPTWGASGSAPSLGNGAIYGRYVQVADKEYRVHIGLKMGSTTTYGSGGWTFSLPSLTVGDPLGAGAGGYASTMGFGFAQNVVGSAYYAVACLVVPHTGSPADLILPVTTLGGTGTQLSSTVPFSWASTDALFLSADVITT